MSKYCGNCGRVVYHAEQVVANGGVYHNSCFICVNAECGRRLDSRSCNQHDGKLYCNFCYKNLFGPSGIGFGGLCIRKQNDIPNQQRPVNAATDRMEPFILPQNDINSVKFYDNSCHHYQQQANVTHRPSQQQPVIYTPLRTWYH